MQLVNNFLLSPWVSITERTDHSKNSWQYVVTQKRVSDTEYEMVDGRPDLRSRLHHIPTGRLFHADNLPIISGKCFLLALITPIVALLKTVYYLAVDALAAIGDIADLMNNHVQKALQKQDYASLFLMGTYTFVEALVTSVAKIAWGILRHPWHAIGLEIAAINGALFDPLAAMSDISEIDSSWNNNVDRHYDWRYPGGPRMEGGVPAFFIAYCMQPKGNANTTLNGSSTKLYEIVVAKPTYQELARDYPAVCLRSDSTCDGFPVCGGS